MVSRPLKSDAISKHKPGVNMPIATDDNAQTSTTGILAPSALPTVRELEIVEGQHVMKWYSVVM